MCFQTSLGFDTPAMQFAQERSSSVRRRLGKGKLVGYKYSNSRMYALHEGSTHGKYVKGTFFDIGPILVHNLVENGKAEQRNVIIGVNEDKTETTIYDRAFPLDPEDEVYDSMQTHHAFIQLPKKRCPKCKGSGTSGWWVFKSTCPKMVYGFKTEPTRIMLPGKGNIKFEPHPTNCKKLQKWVDFIAKSVEKAHKRNKKGFYIYPGQTVYNLFNFEMPKECFTTKVLPEKMWIERGIKGKVLSVCKNGDVVVEFEVSSEEIDRMGGGISNIMQPHEISALVPQLFELGDRVEGLYDGKWYNATVADPRSQGLVPLSPLANKIFLHWEDGNTSHLKIENVRTEAV